jgi:hypothetical protein
MRLMSCDKIPPLTILRASPSESPAAADDPEWEPRYDHRGLVCAHTRRTADGGWIYLPGLAGYRFTYGAEQVTAYPERNAASDVIVEAYYRVALPMILHAGEHEVLHASAVRDGAGVHVFCGASRAGKSTLAYALRRRGFEVWADDAVAFSVVRGAVMAIPLPFALRLRRDAAQLFEQPRRVRGATGKVETLRSHGSESAPIASAWVLERDHASTIRRLSAQEALPAVLHHSFYFSLEKASVRHRMASQFLEFVTQVRTYRLSYPPKLDHIHALLDDVQAELVSTGPVASA